jgi:hypothetical protein
VAGLGFDYFKKDCEERNSKNLAWPKYVLTLGFIFMIAFGSLNIFNEPITAYLQEIGWDQPKYNATATNLFNFKRFLVFTSLFCLGLFLYSTDKFKKPYTLITLMALLILDLYFAHANYYHKEEFKQIQETGENAKFILSDPEVFRIYVTSETGKKTRDFKRNGKKLDFRKEKFMLGLLGNQRILNIDGIGVTQQQRWQEFTHLIKTAPEVDNTNLLNMLNVKYVVSIPAITSPNYELVHSHEPIPQDPKEKEEFENSATLKIYENKTSLAHAFLVPQCRVLNTAREYKETFERKDFNPEQILLLDAEPKNFPCSEKKGSEKKGSVQIDSYQSNTLDISVNLPSRQFLFLSDSYFPGWKAYVDGKEREILRANYLFRAVIIEPGEHQVHFSYEPFSFKLGLVISLTTLLICGVFFWRKRTSKIIPATQQ